MIYQQIDERLRARGSSLHWLSEQVGCTRSGLYRALKNETLRVNQLRKICQILDVSADELLNLRSEENQLVKLQSSIDVILKKLECNP